jgi:hypothetical protein
MDRNSIAEGIVQLAIAILAITSIIAYIFDDLNGNYEIPVVAGTIIFWIGMIVGITSDG